MKKLLTAVTILGLVTVGCGTDTKDIDFNPGNDENDFKRNAEEFIESTEVESQAGTTFTDAKCEAPAEIPVGEKFTCTAVDSDGETWDFDLEVTSSNGYEIVGGQPR